MKLMTYNIHGATGMDNVISLERIARTILAQKPDFVSVNEIDVNCVRTNCADQPAELAKLLGMNHYFGEALQLRAPRWPEQEDRIGLYGLAFFTPHTISEIHQFSLPGLPEMEPRIAVSVRVEAPTPFYAVVTHFCWEPKYESWRLESVKRIREELGRIRTLHPEMPVFLLGDLNAEPGSAPIEALRQDWTIAGEGHFQPTHPADNPVEIIDYIMLAPRGKGAFTQVEIVPEPVASDHRPLTAEVEIHDADTRTTLE